jgi:hemolysin D
MSSALRFSSKQSGKINRENVIHLFQSESAEILEIPEPFGIRATTYVAVALVIAAIVLAWFVKLDRVVSSTGGEIVSTTANEILQSMDPAIIKTINAQVGDRVKKGQVLATLDPTFATADVDTLRLQVANYDAIIARTQAELSGRVYKPAPSKDLEVDRYGKIQEALFIQRKSQYDEQMRAYTAQLSEQMAVLDKLKNDQSRYNERIKIAAEIEGMRRDLYQMQVGSKLNQLTAIDQKTELLRSMEFDRNTITETAEKVKAAQATRDSYAQKWLSDTSQELVNARKERDTANRQLEKAIRKKDLVVLKANQDSVVMSWAQHSVGSVLKDAEPLITLAQLNAPVEAEIRISPKDIGFIRPGDPVKMKLEAFDYVEHGLLTGSVAWISEGTFKIDDATNQPVQLSYYKARVNLTDTSLRNIPSSFRIIPGMTLSGDIRIGERSILMYLISGAIKGVSEGMREPQ